MFVWCNFIICQVSQWPQPFCGSSHLEQWFIDFSDSTQMCKQKTEVKNKHAHWWIHRPLSCQSVDPWTLSLLWATFFYSLEPVKTVFLDLLTHSELDHYGDKAERIYVQPWSKYLPHDKPVTWAPELEFNNTVNRAMTRQNGMILTCQDSTFQRKKVKLLTGEWHSSALWCYVKLVKQLPPPSKKKDFSFHQPPYTLHFPTAFTPHLEYLLKQSLGQDVD